MSGSFFEKRDNGILLDLRVTTGSTSFEVGEVDSWRNQLQVYVVSEPRRGKANRELLEKFQEIIGRDIEIVSGQKSRNKKIFVRSVSPEELFQKLDLDI